MAPPHLLDAIAPAGKQKAGADPVCRLGIVDATLKDIEDEVNQQVNEATEIAKASPPPSLDGIYQHVWADGGASWRN